MNSTTPIHSTTTARQRNCPCFLIFAACVLILAMVTACGPSAPTVNPVKSIEPNALKELINADGYTGFLVAFAAWCPPCKAELPDLVALYRAYKDKGIQIVGMSLDENPEAAQPLVDRLAVPFPVYWVGTAAMNDYGIVGVPTLMVVKAGKIVEKRPGRQSYRELERKIEALLD